MINTEIEARELLNTLKNIYKTLQIEIEPSDNDTCVIVQNPYGGQNLKIFTNDFDREFKIIYRNTPHFYPADNQGTEALLKAINDYINNKVAYLDLTSSSHQDFPRDRLVHNTELPEADLEKLSRLCINKNLLSESDLRFELQSGSSINVHFWDTAKNFCYKMHSGKLSKA